MLGGVDESIAILRLCSDEPEALNIRALYDGDRVEPWETVLTIGRLRLRPPRDGVPRHPRPPHALVET